MSITDRLCELGIELPPAPGAVAAYVPALLHGDLVYTSGQLPMVDGKLAATGLVGRDVDPDRARELARICALNALAAASHVAGSVDALQSVVKVTGFVASAAGFRGQPGVVDGASTLFNELFGTAGRHARSAVGVAELPLGAPVEVEVVFGAARDW